jgi:hypothetical protein
LVLESGLVAFVVFAGQSNMGGVGQDASTLPATWKPDPLTFIWNDLAGAWQQMQPGVNTGYANLAQTWGPEVQFAIDFRAEHPGDPLYIVKNVAGGTLLAASAAPTWDWSPMSRGELYDQTTQMIQRAGAAIGSPRLEAVFWGQGEQDASFVETAPYYGQNLTQFFADIRSDWLHDPNGKIGFFRIGTSLGYADQVRSAELSVDQADPNATSFDTAAFPRQADAVHLTNVGLDETGDGFYQLYRDWSGAGGAGQHLALTASGTLNGGFGDDTLQGSGGADGLRGGGGDDVVFGGAGADLVNGNTGGDTVHGEAGDDTLSGGQGGDAVFGEADNDVIFGNLGDDTLDGGFNADLIRGGQDNDVIDGGSGDDWLSGDRGSDTITGGTGADTFHGFAGAGLDRITDFHAEEGDRVLLDAGTAYTASQVGADVVIEMSGSQMVLANVQLATLPPGWIVVG